METIPQTSHVDTLSIMIDNILSQYNYSPEQETSSLLSLAEQQMQDSGGVCTELIEAISCSLSSVLDSERKEPLKQEFIRITMQTQQEVQTTTDAVPATITQSSLVEGDTIYAGGSFGPKQSALRYKIGNPDQFRKAA